MKIKILSYREVFIIYSEETFTYKNLVIDPNECYALDSYYYNDYYVLLKHKNAKVVMWPIGALNIYEHKTDNLYKDSRSIALFRMFIDKTNTLLIATNKNNLNEAGSHMFKYASPDILNKEDFNSIYRKLRSVDASIFHPLIQSEFVDKGQLQIINPEEPEDLLYKINS